MAVNERIAKRAFEKARKFYEGGLKSSNKEYDVDASPWYKRWFGSAEKANERSGRADLSLGITRSSTAFGGLTTIQQGELLVNSNAQAANCDELTKVSCYWATQYNALGTEVFRVVLTAPADHVFCLLGSLADVTQLVGVAVHRLDTHNNLNVYVIDPWANSYCRVHEYPAKAEAKLKKWVRDGKRVYWANRSTGAGFCETDGEYLLRFLLAQLTIYAAN